MTDSAVLDVYRQSGQRPPLLVVLSGPSGVGKDSVIRELRSRLPDLHYAITATTRPPRTGEVDGVSYYFLTRDHYDRLQDRGELLAPAQVHGHWYGAPLSPIRRMLDGGKDVLLKIDVQGAIAVRRVLPQAAFIFLAPPSIDDLVARLTARHTESSSDLQRRLADASFEMDQMPHYDYCVVNWDDDLAGSAANVACIITAERMRTHRQPIVLEKH